MAAGDVTRFMSDHADDLSGAGRLSDQARVDEQPLSAGDEGVEGVVLDQMNLDRGNIEFCGAENWRRELANGIFNLRIADQGDFLSVGGSRVNHQDGGNQTNRGEIENAFQQDFQLPKWASDDAGR